MANTVNISCGLCSNDIELPLELPNGWQLRYGSVEEEHGFCPKHSIIADFADAQCTGCVGGWADCDLWRGFAYEELKLNAEDFAKLERGFCPRRTNGTLFFSAEAGLREENISTAASIESGKALAKAIKDYRRKYCKKANP